MNEPINARLNKIDKILIDLIEDLKVKSHEALNRKSSPDSWSALQTIHHLILVEKNAHSYLVKKLSFNPKLNNAGIMAALRTFGINFYLNSPIKAKAPKQVSGDNLPIESEFGETVNNWKKQREELRIFLNTLPLSIFEKEAYNHPVAGRMTILQMLSFFEAHFNNHRKQINRAISI